MGAEPLGSAAPDGGGQCADSGRHGGRTLGSDHAAHRLAELSVTLETGGRADLKELTDRLLQAGYSRCDQVEGVGQFARGAVFWMCSPP